MTSISDSPSKDLRIFISYRRDGSAAYAGRLYDSLVVQFGQDQVFMDVDAIRPGRDFAKAITDAVEECDVLLALIDPTWATVADSQGRRRLDNPEDFVRMELSAALKRDILVIPVLVQNARMPSRRELPDALSSLAFRQAFELSDRRWRIDTRALIDELDGIPLGINTPSMEVGGPPQHPKSLDVRPGRAASVASGGTPGSPETSIKSGVEANSIDGAGALASSADEMQKDSLSELDETRRGGRIGSSLPPDQRSPFKIDDPAQLSTNLDSHESTLSNQVSPPAPHAPPATTPPPPTNRQHSGRQSSAVRSANGSNPKGTFGSIRTFAPRGCAPLLIAAILTVIVFAAVLTSIKQTGDDAARSTDGHETANVAVSQEQIRAISLGTDSIFAIATTLLAGQPVVVAQQNYSGQQQARDLATGAPSGKPFENGWSDATAIAVAELGGRDVIVTAIAYQILVWDLETGTSIGQTIGPPLGDPEASTAASFTSVSIAQLDGRPVIVAGDYTGIVTVWDLDTRAQIGAPLIGHTDSVFAVASIQLEGRTVIATGDRDGAIWFWDLATHAPFGQPISIQSTAVFALTSAQINGQAVIVSAGSDGAVRLWDSATHTQVGDPLTGHTDQVNALATTEIDGQPIIVSGSGDKTLRVWNLATHRLVGPPLTGHTDSVNALATTQIDGQPIIVSGSSDSSLRVWEIPRRS